MWLLDTATAVLHEFIGPEKVPEGYAILSHVWGKDEQSFQEVKDIIERCKKLGKNPRDEVSEKIRRCCKTAEREGYKWVWIDTCCIDKTSSAELSEAINSMYRYYALSEVCFVYLDDVADADITRGRKTDRLWSLSPRRCRWLTRGWTLQELIAPTVVILFSSSWTPIGSKHSVADNLEQSTHIPAPLLRHETHLSDYSVAQRMSWAARRRTTRIEDEAYCLLGIFDINMPTLYGEGRRAFRRLQEEIMKTQPDTSLFAWGRAHAKYTLTTVLDDPVKTWLLARTPRDFSDCPGVRYSSASNTHETPMTFMMTAHGIQAQVLLLEFEGRTYINLSCTKGGKPVLLCVEKPLTGGIYSVIRPRHGPRVCIVPSGGGPVPCGQITPIYIANGPASDLGSPSPAKRFESLKFPCNGNLDAPFHFSFTSNEIPAHNLGSQKVAIVHNVQDSWTGSPAAIMIFKRLGPNVPSFFVLCGVCTAHTIPERSPPEPSSNIHWARSVWPSYTAGRIDSSTLNNHDCATDHIADWEGQKRTFRGHLLEVTLSFVKSQLYSKTLILRSVTWEKFHVTGPGADDSNHNMDAGSTRSDPGCHTAPKSRPISVFGDPNPVSSPNVSAADYLFSDDSMTRPQQ